LAEARASTAAAARSNSTQPTKTQPKPDFRSENREGRAQARLTAARAVVEQMELEYRAYDLPGSFDCNIEAGHVEQGRFTVKIGESRQWIVDLDPNYLSLDAISVKAAASERSRKHDRHT